MNIKIANLDDNREIRRLNSNGTQFYDCYFEEEPVTIFFPKQIADEVSAFYTDKLEEDPFGIWTIREDIYNYFLEYEEYILDLVIDKIKEFGNKVEE